MEIFSFSPNSLVPETMPRENSNVVSMGGWQFSARPTSTMQNRYRVNLHGMRWYLASNFSYDSTTNPTLNARALELFYAAHEMWKPFFWYHPHKGWIVVRFAGPLTIPAAPAGNDGMLEPLEINFVEEGIPVTSQYQPWALGLDFLNNVYYLGGVAYPLATLMTFSRASIGTRTNIAGTLESIASGLPRMNYDPVTHAPLGLLKEVSRTNLLLNAVLAGTNLATQSVAVTAQSYTLSFYGTGTITLSNAHVQSVVGTGVYPNRRTYTFTPTAGTLTLTVSGTVQYAQLEAGAFETSFIPTAGASVTRQADSLTMTGTYFNSFFTPSTGTMVVEMNTNQPDNATGTGIATSNVAIVIRSDTNNFYSINKSDTSTRTNQYSAARVVGGSPTLLESADNLFPINTVIRLAYTYNELTDVHAVSRNGGTPLSGSFTANTMPAPTLLELAVGLNGHLRFAGFYKQHSSNAQLQVFSTP